MSALSDITFPSAPAFSPEARERAVSAAMEGFDRRQRTRALTGRGSGTAHLRPVPRRFVIRRHQAALAASLALLVGGPLTYIVARDHAAAPKLERTHPTLKEGEGRLPDPQPKGAEVNVPLPEAAGPAVVPEHRGSAGELHAGKRVRALIQPGVGSAPQTEVGSSARVAADSAAVRSSPRLKDEPGWQVQGRLKLNLPSMARGDAAWLREGYAAPPAVANGSSSGPGVIASAPRLARPALVDTLMRAEPPSPGRQATLMQERLFLGEAPPTAAEPSGRDQFEGAEQNGFKIAKEYPVSTFSIDVDTASYSFARASLNRNVLPQPASVRTEEMINYFPYDYPAPISPSEPFRADVAVFPSPFTDGRKLVRIGIKGYAVQMAERPRANLVFLIDTSGSMNAPNRLPLVKQSLAMLLDQLGPGDRVAIVTYAGHAGTALEPTAASEKAKILSAVDGLDAGGSTAGGEGIRQAYALAERGFDKEAVNRVVLVTDGDFNVGITNRDELKGFVERERGKGIFLSVLGFGMGNYNDALMQSLAQNGNGAAAYIDTLGEARKVLVEEATSTLIPIAKDVKIQVEFNPATVQEYRLVGYETRMLRHEDFNNDKVDAGDVGSGQSVTALYEIVPVGAPKSVAELRYAPVTASETKAQEAREHEYGFVNIRYKLPKSDTSTLISAPIAKAGEAASFDAAPREARFATAVAGFAELLRGGKHTGRFGFDDVVRVAQGAKGEDPYGYRAEFVNLARAAKTARSLGAQRR